MKILSKKIILGTRYDPEFFEKLPDNRIEELLGFKR
jgi:hypothetical protein